MKSVYALYTSGDAAQRAVNSLRSAGYGDNDITVISAAPMEEFEFSHIGRESFQWYIACGGALLGFLASTWLTTFGENAWPISVGNMPIVAWYPNLIVVFEMTMAGAIISTVITLVVTAGLARRMPKLYDPEVTAGKILVGIASPRDESGADVERALRAAPGGQLKTV
ncbi:MAG TPA: quinol:electron acceptor oxidoreductase subunit ActD [Vicinamibacterales bacterium]|nr:quinol:electron acceptor oxidoreductase subunit ActD [Vicinamibacterales bacterium]